MPKIFNRVTDIQTERLALYKEFQQRVAAGAQGLSEIEREREAALADLGRVLLKQRDRVVIAPDVLQSLIGADARVEQAALAVETHTRALTAYDRARVSDGEWILGAALLLVLSAIALAIWLV
jgi:hypothetical protein